MNQKQFEQFVEEEHKPGAIWVFVIPIIILVVFASVIYLTTLLF